LEGNEPNYICRSILAYRWVFFAGNEPNYLQVIGMICKSEEESLAGMIPNYLLADQKEQRPFKSNCNTKVNKS